MRVLLLSVGMQWSAMSNYVGGVRILEHPEVVSVREIERLLQATADAQWDAYSEKEKGAMEKLWSNDHYIQRQRGERVPSMKEVRRKAAEYIQKRILNATKAGFVFETDAEPPKASAAPLESRNILEEEGWGADYARTEEADFKLDVEDTPLPAARKGRRAIRELDEAGKAKRQKRLEKYNKKRRKLNSEKENAAAAMLAAKRRIEDMEIEERRVSEERELEVALANEPDFKHDDAVFDAPLEASSPVPPEPLPEPEGPSRENVMKTLVEFTARAMEGERPEIRVERLGTFVASLYRTVYFFEHDEQLPTPNIEDFMLAYGDAVRARLGDDAAPAVTALKNALIPRGAEGVDSDDEPLLPPREFKTPRARPKPKKASYVLTPTGPGPWAEICRAASSEWTASLKKLEREGKLPKDAWDGKPITPEQWNRGGTSQWQFKNMSPKRASKYQVFTRQQRKARSAPVPPGWERREELKRELAEPPGHVVADWDLMDLADLRWLYDTSLRGSDSTFLPRPMLHPILFPEMLKGAPLGAYYIWAYVAAWGVCFFEWKMKFMEFGKSDMYRMIAVAYHLSDADEDEFIHPGITEDDWRADAAHFTLDGPARDFVEGRKTTWGTLRSTDSHWGALRPSTAGRPPRKTEFEKGGPDYALGFKQWVCFIGLANIYVAQLVGAEHTEYQKSADHYKKLVLLLDPLEISKRGGGLDEVMEPYNRDLFIDGVHGYFAGMELVKRN